MEIRMTRTFANVGQGLFAIEKFYDREKVIFCAVYDCGMGTGKQINKEFKSIIDKNLGGKETVLIDVLFVSHFDSDHVNGIPYILERYEVRNLVLPLIHDDVRALMVSKIVDKRDGDKRVEYDLLVRPKEFVERYSKDLHIYYVRDEDSNGDTIDREDLVSYGECFLPKIGNPLKIDEKTYIWEYIPYNLKINNYQKYLDKLQDLGQRDKFLSDVVRKTNCSNAFKETKYSDDDLKGFICNLFNNLKEIGKMVENYDKIFFAEFYRRFIQYCNHLPNSSSIQDDKNLLNINSLIVYSGPINTNCKVTDACVRLICDDYNELYNCYRFKFDKTNVNNCICIRSMLNNAGCLFCGDVNGKEASFKQVLRNHESKLMCMQVPHHGSKHNNDVDTLKEYIYYVICAGENNRYGHPSASVIAMLMTKKKIYRIVTESEKSKLNFEYILG